MTGITTQHALTEQSTIVTDDLLGLPFLIRSKRMTTRIFFRFCIINTAKANIELTIFTWANHTRPFLHLTKHTFKTSSFVHQQFVLIRTPYSFALKTLITNIIMTWLHRTTDPFSWVLLLPTIITNCFASFVLDVTVMTIIA